MGQLLGICAWVASVFEEKVHAHFQVDVKKPEFALVDTSRINFGFGGLNSWQPQHKIFPL